MTHNLQIASSGTPIPVLDQILRLPQVKSTSGLGKSSIYKGVQSGTFPAPIALGSRAIGWKSSTISAWLASRKPATQKAEL